MDFDTTTTNTVNGLTATFAMRKTEQSRYIVVIRMTKEIGGKWYEMENTRSMFYCPTIRDARNVARRSTKAKGQAHESTLHSSFTSVNVPAGFVKTQTRRYGRCVLGVGCLEIQQEACSS